MTLFTPVWCVLLLCSATYATNIEDFLQVYISEALINNPELQAYEQRWKMYEHKIVPAASFSDPRLSLGLSNYPVDTLKSDIYPMTGNDIRLDQAIPFPGTLSLKEELATSQAHLEKSRYRDKKDQIIKDIRDTWFRLYAVEQSTTLHKANLNSVDQLIRLSETRYSVGKGRQQDVLNAQLKRSALMNKLIVLGQQRETLLLQFQSLLGRPQPAKIEVPASLDPSVSIPELEDTLAKLEERRSAFAERKALIDEFDVKQKLSSKAYYPDLNLWAGYRFRDDELPDGGEDFVSAGISFNLPIYLAKRRAADANASSGALMARKQYEDLRIKVEAEIRSTHAQMVSKRDQVLLYRTAVIPQAQQSYEAALREYQVDRITFGELIGHQLALYEYQVDYHRELSEMHRLRAHFDYLAGIQVDPVNKDKQ